MMNARRAAIRWMLGLASAGVVGCAGSKPGPLSAQFGTPSARTQNPLPADPLSAADQAGQKEAQSPGATSRPAIASTARTEATSTSAPSIGASSGQYYTLGGVVAEVNNTPIYANKVLSLVEPVLAARARELTPEQFRLAATEKIRGQRDALVEDQLLYAAAERNLDAKEKDIADMMTAQWRNQQITIAGGSLELARSRAVAHGDNFDELVQQQYRRNMILLYFRKKVFPRIQVTAGDIRAYYNAHRDTEFTHPGVARFRLIKIDVRKSGGREQALAKITELRRCVVKGGESFDGVAHEVNDDPRLLRTGGDLGAPIQKGAFFSDKVEQSVWSTPDGQITPVIDAGDALYLADVESKTASQVRPFEDDAVQDQIETTLKNQQFIVMRRQAVERLIREAIVRTNDDMLNIAVEMAMENYPKWSRGR